MELFRRTLLSFCIGDIALILFLTYGSVFPSRMTLLEPGRAMPEAYYDYSAKSSPFEVRRDSPRAVAQSMPKISARPL